ncbi:MAG: hypothetical protein WKF59_21830 [Chitinophagaceae bacterium]
MEVEIKAVKVVVEIKVDKAGGGDTKVVVVKEDQAEGIDPNKILLFYVPATAGIFLL